MIAIINTMFLIGVYMLLLAFILTHINDRPDNRGDDDRGGGGGWDSSDDPPPLDLPPGVFVLPPDEEDTSPHKHLPHQEEVEMAV